MKAKKLLLLKLKKFGLNPLEWKITIQSGKGQLTHIQERDFCLEGGIVRVNGKTEWTGLQVISPDSV
ncbi:MAG: hypothetical protein OXB86_01115 [Bdellovibrionales bacterium]|nr:hypothetical protein [Bdellovibrionales bacterium]